MVNFGTKSQLAVLGHDDNGRDAHSGGDDSFMAGLMMVLFYGDNDDNIDDDDNDDMRNLVL